MRQLITLLLFLVSTTVLAQKKSAVDEIIAFETAFAEAIKNRDTVATKNMQADTYFLAVGIKGTPLQIVPQDRWLHNLKRYVVESYSVDDIKVNVYGNTAVALMLFTQKATANGMDRSAQFIITDIWIKKGNSWVIAERHSSRPEVPTDK